MIEAVSKIGSHIQKNSSADLLETLIENPNNNGKYNHALVVILEEKNGELSYNGVELQELKDFRKYLYKGKKGNSTDATPTCKIAKNIETTFKKKFLRWFESYEDCSLSRAETSTLDGMKNVIFSNRDKIFGDLQEKQSLLKAGDNCIITLGIEVEGDLKYLADYPAFRNILVKKVCDRFSKKYGGESKGNDVLCSVCKKKKDEVYGFAIPWTFHTFDKPGFIAGGFRHSDAWKNTPVCFDCAMRLEAGKKYVEERLDFSFYGFRYLLIPKLVIGDDYEEVLSILRAQKRDLNMSREVRNRITDDEDEILGIVKDQKDFFSNSLVFYRRQNNEFRILLHIEGILPSRLRSLFSAKEKVDERFKIYNDTILSEAQREKNRLEFNFEVLRRFFPRESKNRTFDKIFLEIVDKIFVGAKIDYNLLMDFIMRRVRAAFIEDHPTNITTLNGFLLIHYINELNLFRTTEAEMKNMNEPRSGVLRIEELEDLPLEQRVERFFEANEAFFNSDAKKATFLEGVLAQNLLNIQWMKKNATPFRAKLHGLKMNEALIKRLLPEIQNKLEEYKTNYYRDLEQIIANHFVLSGVNWKEVDDELSFYFVLGMNLHKLFKNANDNEEKIEGEA